MSMLFSERECHGTISITYPMLKQAFFRNPAPKTAQSPKLLIFDTHPIQYRSPVFKELKKRLPEFKVYYFNETFNGNLWWFHEVGKIPPQNWELPLRAGFENQIVGTAGNAPWRNYSRLRKVIQTEKPAAILLYGYYLPEHWEILQAAKKMRIPVLFIGETFTEGSSSLRRFFKGPLVKYFFSNVSHFVAIGDRTHAFYRHWEIPKEKITLAKYCVDTQFFNLSREVSETLRKELRASLKIPADAFVNLFVGRLFERKRPKDVLQVHQWYKNDPKFYTIIVGNGPMEEELKKEAAPFERIFFVGFKNQTETRAFYHASDLLYVPSEYETWGLVINEAFASGIPALVTSTCGASGDLVLHGETGFSYPVGNVPRAISFVDRLMKHPAQSKAMGENAKRKVITDYTPENFADSIVRAFKVCVK